MDSKDETHEREEIRKNVRKKILDVIDEIMEKASDDEYIYRGQSGTICKSDVISKSDAVSQSDDAFPQVTSTLYRALYRALYHAMKKRHEENGDDEWLNEGVNERVNMNLIQEEALNSARYFTSENYNDDEMLSRIQHYSGDTNLIDFTKDYLVALFFACDQKYGEDGEGGKVFLLKTSNLKDGKIKIITPVHPSNRITVQKSVFLQSPTGIISDGMMEIVDIPLELKQPILDYLKAHHDISLPSIYNDLHGYIRNREEHGKSVMEFNLGVYYGDKSRNVQSLEKKSGALEKAMGHFDKAIQLDPKYVRAYNGRGNIKKVLGDMPGAISEYDTAIALDPKYALAYINRGNAKWGLGYVSGVIDWEDVMRDYDKAIALASKDALAPNDALAYHNRGNAKLELRDVSGAMKDYDKAIELNPNNAEVYTDRGLAKGKLNGMLGDMPGAISDYGKTIELDPEYARAYYNRGLAKERLGGDRQNLEQALFDFENAEKLILQQNIQDMVKSVQEVIKRVKAKMSKL